MQDIDEESDLFKKNSIINRAGEKQMRMYRFLVCCALFLLASGPLHGQSGIELPKPNTGVLGIHFKIVQSIPVESHGRSGRIRLTADGSLVVALDKTFGLPDKE